MIRSSKLQAIAASAYNVCGPRTGAAATPATIGQFNRALVINCLAEYKLVHDGELFTRLEIEQARYCLLKGGLL